MEKCKTCVYWKEMKAKSTGYCSLLSDTIEGYPAFIEVYVSDSSGLDIDFVTSPEFGCSLHKPPTNN